MIDPVDYIAPDRRAEPGAADFAQVLYRTLWERPLPYRPDFHGKGVWMWDEPIPPARDFDAAAQRLALELARFV